jgi:hypothetical protein
MLIFYFILGAVASPYFIRDFLLTGKIVSSEHYSFAIAKYRFSSQGPSFDTTWQLKGIPSLKNAVDLLGIKYVIKDSLSQIILGLRSLLLWADVVPSFILFLFFGYLMATPLKDADRIQRNFFITFAVFFSLSFLLYTVYAGYEARHLRIFIPFFIIFAVKFIFTVIDNILESDYPPIEKYLKLSVVALLFFIYAGAMLGTSFKRIKEQVSDTQTHSILSGVTWIKNNTAPNDSIMSYDICALGFHTGRKTIMVPNLKIEEIIKVAKKYNAKYIYMDLLTQSRRPNLFSFCEQHPQNFRKVFAKDEVSIYLIQ